jgi:hypothetical protein
MLRRNITRRFVVEAYNMFEEIEKLEEAFYFEQEDDIPYRTKRVKRPEEDVRTEKAYRPEGTLCG